MGLERGGVWVTCQVRSQSFLFFEEEVAASPRELRVRASLRGIRVRFNEEMFGDDWEGGQPFRAYEKKK